MNIPAEESPLVYLCSSVLWTHWNQCKEIPESLGFLYCVRMVGALWEGGREWEGREATQADMKSADAAGRYQWGCQSTHDKSAPVEPESRECRNMCKHLNCNYCKSGIPTSWLTVISEHCWKLIRKLPFIYKYVGKSGHRVLSSEATKFCVGLKTSRNETKVLKFITIYFPYFLWQFQCW